MNSVEGKLSIKSMFNDFHFIAYQKMMKMPCNDLMSYTLLMCVMSFGAEC